MHVYNFLHRQIRVGRNDPLDQQVGVLIPVCPAGLYFSFIVSEDMALTESLSQSSKPQLARGRSRLGPDGGSEGQGGHGPLRVGRPTGWGSG